MAFLARQSTATTVPVGPCVDKDDGVTPETGLAAGTVDEIGLYKHEGTSLVDISGTTTLTHRAGGMYTATFSETDTNTLGRLRFYLRDDSICLPVWEDFLVVTANVFDSLCGSDKLDTNVAEVSGDSAAADNLEALFDGTGYDAAEQAIADEVLKRGISNVEDVANATSLAALVLAAFESAISGGTWTIYKTNGVSVFTTKGVTTDSGADPIVAVT